MLTANAGDPEPQSDIVPEAEERPSFLVPNEELHEPQSPKKDPRDLTDNTLALEEPQPKYNALTPPEQPEAHYRTRRGLRKGDQKHYDYRRQTPLDNHPAPENKQEVQQKVPLHKKQEDKHLDVYLKIVQYLKKIEWDKSTAIHKMNPFQYLTPACFWFWICAEFFSFNFGCKKTTPEAINDILNRLNKIRYPIALRLGKILQPIHPGRKLIDFETRKLRNTSLPIVQVLSDCIPSIMVLAYQDPIDKNPHPTQTVDDSVFRMLNRSSVYNYVKKNCLGHIKTLVQNGVTELNQSEEPALQMEEEKVNSQPEQISRHSNKQGPEQECVEKAMEIEIEIEKVVEQQQQCVKSCPESSLQPNPTKREYTEEDLLLETILQLPLEKIISILEYQIPKIKIPPVEEYLIPLSSDPFELISPPHFFESRFMEYLKQENQKKSSQNQKVQIPKTKFVEENVTEDIKCQVCTDGDYTDDNLIVFCSTCNISVHQRCVGLAKVPAQSWICEVCHAFGPKGRWLRCALCTVRGGALKRTTISSQTNLFKDTNPSYHDYIKGCPHVKSKQQFQIPQADPDNQNRLFYDYYDPITAPVQEPMCNYVWIHYSCSIWVPECYFQERSGVINIKGVDCIDKKRFKIMCEVCQTNRTGAAVKCAEEGCLCHYHPECARVSGIYMEQRYLDTVKYFIYCKNHEPLKITRIKESKAKKNKDEIIKFCRSIQKYVQTYKIACVPFKLLKSTKKVKGKKQQKTKEVREAKQNDNADFMNKLRDFLVGGRKLVVQLRKVGEMAFKVIDIQQPVKRTLKSNINKNDEVWQYFTYKNLSGIQMYKKYKRVMKEMPQIKDRFCRDIRNQTKSDKKKDKRRGKELEEYAIEQDPDKLYCVCKQKYIDGEFMLQCEICQQWYHFKCIGFTGTENDAEKVIFNCPQCEEYQDAAQIQERREKYADFYIPGFVIEYQKPKQEEEDQVQAQESLSQLSNNDQSSESSQQSDHLEQNDNPESLQPVNQGPQEKAMQMQACKQNSADQQNLATPVPTPADHKQVSDMM